MPNMTLQKTPAREQEPNIRNKNFKEVSQGYDEELALNEASRCLNCKNMPCVSGCPVNVRIPEFIAKIAAHDYEGAYAIIKTTNSLPAICGRVCPQENQCESKCVRGIKGEPVGIGRLERFAADYAMAKGSAPAEIPSRLAPSSLVPQLGFLGADDYGRHDPRRRALSLLDAALC